jgi:outer membrane murein-binding lipoprotein Lpp
MDKTAIFRLRGPAALLAALAGAPVFLGCIGCAGADRLQKQVSGLETQLTTMRADQDRLEERLAALELGTASAKAAPSPAAERVERPRLKVIHLAPDEAEGAAAEPAEPAPPSTANDAAHRPIIRGTGDRVIKVGDGDSDESTSREIGSGKSVAQLGKDAHGN